MKTIDLEKQKPDLDSIIEMARHEVVLLLLPDGRELCIAEADDFDKEIDALRQSRGFQKLLEQRSSRRSAVSLEELEDQITAEIARKRADREMSTGSQGHPRGQTRAARGPRRKA